MVSFLFPSSPSKVSEIDSICVGSGRFLRSVLVPALIASNLKPIIVQTRGRTFMDYCRERGGADCWTYEVDTVEHDGKVTTESIPCYGAGTLGTDGGKQDVLALLSQMKNIKMIGVGVTEAGLSSSSTKAMTDLADVLMEVSRLCKEGRLGCDNPNGKICVVNTDNVPTNGDMLEKFMLEIAKDRALEDFRQFLQDRVVFHNTMVDRITSQRPGSNGLVPRAEPTPAKALVIQDLQQDLPAELLTDEIQRKYGVVVRKEEGQLDADIALKLRVANGTHTAVAHVMALCQLVMTDFLSSNDDEGHAAMLMKYLDSFFLEQILVGVVQTDDFQSSANDAQYVYDDWRRRLMHAHFGLSSFFITQNGAAKGGIRIGPSIRDLVMHGQHVTCSTVFALAAILRFLTPAAPTLTPKNGIYRGWLDKSERNGGGISTNTDSTVVYADRLSYNLEEGWYEFRCACNVTVPSIASGEKPLSEHLASFATTQQPSCYEDVVRAYLMKNDGGNLSDLVTRPYTKDKFTVLVKAVSAVYARMVAGDEMLHILKELNLEASCECLVDGVSNNNNNNLDDYRPLHYRTSSIPKASYLLKGNIGSSREHIKSVVFSEVASAVAIDLHTHLLPPSHGALCLWGIDELLTYHYLVAEYFMTAPPSITPEDFYAESKQMQANKIWKALFMERSPISEACRGVITTLTALGLEKEVFARDLDTIRVFYKKFRDDGVAGAERYSKMVYQKAGVQYAVMTNIPFDPTESQHWRPTPKEYSSNFRSALRVDPLLAGDKQTIESALAASGYDNTIEGARQYLHDWCDTMKPEYMMASTPHDFVLPEDKGSVQKGAKVGVNEDAMKQPFAFTDLTSNNCDNDCDGEDGLASLIDENSDFLSEVLMKVCEERDLPVALKIGAHRRVNPRLLQAGDGVVAFADANMLARLCTRFPNVRFLATFLSRNNQHEACVLSSKFRNLHIYGCWWFCNNPSIIEEITKMRIEMLGTAFTAQHSDSRVLDQLIYKWSHSRAVIANVLAKEYIKLIESGWILNRAELRRDVERLFGSSYEEFMRKSFV